MCVHLININENDVVRVSSAIAVELKFVYYSVERSLLDAITATSVLIDSLQHYMRAMFYMYAYIYEICICNIYIY